MNLIKILVGPQYFSKCYGEEKIGGTKRILKEGVVHDGLAKPLVPSPHHSLVKEEVIDLDNFPSIESMPVE